jgi:hypothetical protein
MQSVGKRQHSLVNGIMRQPDSERLAHRAPAREGALLAESFGAINFGAYHH